MRLMLTVVLAVGLTIVALAADAQQGTKLAKIGLLSVSTPAVVAPNIEAFRQALRERGHVEGTTFVLEVRYGEGRFERLPELARELVGLKMDVIVATSDVVSSVGSG
jgi:putative ABC transport system substrate-binding protein